MYIHVYPAIKNNKEVIHFNNRVSAITTLYIAYLGIFQRENNGQKSPKQFDCDMVCDVQVIHVHSMVGRMPNKYIHTAYPDIEISAYPDIHISSYIK